MRFSLCKEYGNCTLIEIIRTVEAHSITGLVSGEKRRNRALAYSYLRHAPLSASLVDGDGRSSKRNRSVAASALAQARPNRK